MNGYIQKVLDNLPAMIENGDDVTELVKGTADMARGGYDANDDQWSDLNAKCENLPESADGVAGSDRYVSGSPPGSPDNPIGYPGTDQDQGSPGQRPRTVPGQRVNKP